VVSAQIRLSHDDHDRLMQLAASNERSAAAECRYAVRRHLKQYFADVDLVEVQ
jgi:hypothetical protein